MRGRLQQLWALYRPVTVRPHEQPSRCLFVGSELEEVPSAPAGIVTRYVVRKHVAGSQSMASRQRHLLHQYLHRETHNDSLVIGLCVVVAFGCLAQTFEGHASRMR